MCHEKMIRRCFDLAQKASGKTSPNPMVGAVLLHDGIVIGEGWHKEYGAAHAEVDCLNSVLPEHRHLIAASTMYVNLEPCAHYGKTPPCAFRIIEEGIKRVVIANIDPYSEVNGAGITILQQHGCEVVSGILKEEGEWLNRRFFCFHSLRRPYIILKWAASRDGYVAPTNTGNYPITTATTNVLVHKWRTEEDAIIVGLNTARLDNPTLTARHWPGKQPLRIVADRNCSLQPNSNLLNADAATLVLNALKSEQIGNLEYLKIDFDNHFYENLTAILHERKIQSVIVEGGAKLLNNFIGQGLWDEARVFTGSGTIGGGTAAPMLQNAILGASFNIGVDTLQIFTNNTSRYPYVNGMVL
jgi:diaminohydroxyphosphoribosylaminopyrimidine deaminase / 5-amino-6-(5-phosphoribosylamino)uracil reductase